MLTIIYTPNYWTIWAVKPASPVQCCFIHIVTNLFQNYIVDSLWYIPALKLANSYYPDISSAMKKNTLKITHANYLFLEWKILYMLHSLIRHKTIYVGFQLFTVWQKLYIIHEGLLYLLRSNMCGSFATFLLRIGTGGSNTINMITSSVPID